MDVFKIAFKLLQGGTRASQGVSTMMQHAVDRQCERNTRPDIYATEESRERRYEGELSSDAVPIAAAEYFARFAERHLGTWRKGFAAVSNKGVATCEYSAQLTPSLELVPLTWSAGMVRQSRWRRPGGNGLLDARVLYRYRTRFELHALATGGTLLRYRTTELPDPGMSCGYDLVGHFEVPQMPGGFGRVGERFLQFFASGPHREGR